MWNYYEVEVLPFGRKLFKTICFGDLIEAFFCSVKT